MKNAVQDPCFSNQQDSYQLIVRQGNEDGTVNVRRYGQKGNTLAAVDEFVEAILADIANKSMLKIMIKNSLCGFFLSSVSFWLFIFSFL